MHILLLSIAQFIKMSMNINPESFEKFIFHENSAQTRDRGCEREGNG
jgi:hypothetical protein